MNRLPVFEASCGPLVCVLRPGDAADPRTVPAGKAAFQHPAELALGHVGSIHAALQVVETRGLSLFFPGAFGAAGAFPRCDFVYGLFNDPAALAAPFPHRPLHAVVVHGLIGFSDADQIPAADPGIIPVRMLSAAARLHTAGAEIKGHDFLHRPAGTDTDPVFPVVSPPAGRRDRGQPSVFLTGCYFCFFNIIHFSFKPVFANQQLPGMLKCR